jgi:hypothetical protein
MGALFSDRVAALVFSFGRRWFFHVHGVHVNGFCRLALTPAEFDFLGA